MQEHGIYKNRALLQEKIMSNYFSASHILQQCLWSDSIPCLKSSKVLSN